MTKNQFRRKYGEKDSEFLEKNNWELIPCDGSCGEGDKCPGWMWHLKSSTEK
jgi:hypothetical protein